MTTDYHDAISSDDPANPAVINAPLQQLDLAIVNLITGGTPFTGIDIDGGAIDGATVGANSAAAGTFTDLTASGDLDFGSVFKAHTGEQQSITNNSLTQIEFGVETLDNNSDYDVDTYRFTPSVAGHYFIYAQVTFADVLAADKEMYLEIQRNGSINSRAAYTSVGTNAESMNCVALYNMNGSTDYFEAHVFQNDTSSKNIAKGEANAYWFGFRMF